MIIKTCQACAKHAPSGMLEIQDMSTAPIPDPVKIPTIIYYSKFMKLKLFDKSHNKFNNFAPSGEAFIMSKNGLPWPGRFWEIVGKFPKNFLNDFLAEESLNFPEPGNCVDANGSLTISESSLFSAKVALLAPIIPFHSTKAASGKTQYANISEFT
ncbi:hypothetical protein K435DRAFT_793746 [Dendrothele bispora CBS 962.96]|uniref:Uncharacterized protein n=1 Tax=Dendrothele bispora (strain CBS 962.96) TaxID=1314807 RepID=A0A4S8MEC2_DENBC|nr:hypothetical protein K435DRAFT_793746 [Dendrothele bispora CBS 962.96]